MAKRSISLWSERRHRPCGPFFCASELITKTVAVITRAQRNCVGIWTLTFMCITTGPGPRLRVTSQPRLTPRCCLCRSVRSGPSPAVRLPRRSDCVDDQRRWREPDGGDGRHRHLRLAHCAPRRRCADQTAALFRRRLHLVRTISCECSVSVHDDVLQRTMPVIPSGTHLARASRAITLFFGSSSLANGSSILGSNLLKLPFSCC